MYTRTAWSILRRFWVIIYAGATVYIGAELETSYISNEFKESALSLGSVVKIVSTKAHERINMVRRSRGHLWTMYDKPRNGRVIVREIDYSCVFVRIMTPPFKPKRISDDHGVCNAPIDSRKWTSWYHETKRTRNSRVHWRCCTNESPKGNSRCWKDEVNSKWRRDGEGEIPTT